MTRDSWRFAAACVLTGLAILATVGLVSMLALVAQP